MANYLQSENISIFPTPNRGTNYQPQARLVTEFNLVNIVNRLVDKESFVISYDNTPAGIENNIIFNIYGYWIKANLKDNSLLTNASNSLLYARIKVVGSDFIELDGTDEKDTSSAEVKYVYKGVDFLTENPDTDAGGYHSLKLLEKVNGTWQVPEDSKVRFTTGTQTRSVTIDDGDLDS